MGSSKGKGGKVSLYPLDLAAALGAAIATGPITDPALKRAKTSQKAKKKPKN
jgi:hypothetical protein